MFVWKIIGVGAIFFIIALYAICREIRKELGEFQTVHYEIASEKLSEKEEKIVFVSDLHNHRYGTKNEELLEAIREEKPAYILVGGDMLVSNNKHGYLPALETMKELAKICPVYCANGNHEQRIKEWIEKFQMSYAAYHRILQEAGIHFLENDSQVLDLNGTKICVTGLEIPIACYKRGQKVRLSQEDMVELVGECKEECYEILLAHNPSYMKTYLQWGADLILSGHLHGGIVRLPVLGGVIAPNFRIFPKYSGGHYKEQGQEVVVSKGLGTHTINIRLWNPAELVVLHMKQKR